MKDLSIPKLYYSISEVSRLTGLEQYVLRYWETVFDELRPQKNRAGNRIYSNQDIKFILKIKELLRERRYTIEGARHLIKEERQAERERGTQEPETTPDPDQIKLSTEAPQGAAPSNAAASAAVNPLVTLSLAEIRAMRDALLSLKSILVRSNER